MERNNERVSFLLQQALVYNRRKNTPTVEQLAEDMGYGLRYLYKIVEGEGSLRFEDFPRLYRLSGGLYDILLDLVRKCDPRLLLTSIEDIGVLNGTIDDEKDSILVTLGQLVEKNRLFMADGHYDENELTELERLFTEIHDSAEQGLAELRAQGADHGQR